MGIVMALTVLSGCGADTPDRSIDWGESRVDYVAVGDSFTAGPLIPTTENEDGCLRSSANYPSLLAEQIPNVRLVDVSCSGAETVHASRPQPMEDRPAWPPQLIALDEETDLVTVGLGANDQDIASTVLSGCVALGLANPDGRPCTDYDRQSDAPVSERIQTMQADLVDVLAEARRRAPDAVVAAVGYPQVIPADGTCPQLLPIAAGDYPWALDRNRELNDAVRAAAAEAEVVFIDPWPLSAGHDICSDDPWFNGQDTDPDRALAFHSFAAYQAAVARLLEEKL